MSVSILDNGLLSQVKRQAVKGERIKTFVYSFHRSYEVSFDFV